MADELTGMQIAFLATDGVEQSELAEPWKAMEEAGARPRLVSIKPESIEAWRHFDKGDRFEVDELAADASAGRYDALVLPGGVANPDQLRTDPAAVAFVRGFFDAGKPVASICHGPWMVIEAGAARGRTLTSWPSLRTDLENAGAKWTDETVVVCHAGDSVLVTSRKPSDLPKFCSAAIWQFAEHRDAHLAAGHTTPDRATEDEARREAFASHSADRPASPEEEAAAERTAGSAGADVEAAYREAAETGARIKGEGQIEG